jgi:hypothetical protein
MGRHFGEKAVQQGMKRYFCAVVIALVVSAGRVGAYAVGPAVSLDKMTAMADLVIKGKVISTAQTNLASFEAVPGFPGFVTRFQVISVLKGNPGGREIVFEHYGVSSNGMAFMYMPQHYEFTPGRSCILFALKTGTPGVFTQLWKSHTAKPDEGEVLSADDKPVKAGTVKEAFWDDLVQLRASRNAEDLVYALNQLAEMSSGSTDADDVIAAGRHPARAPFGGLEDFPRRAVMDLVRPSLTIREDERVLKAAIEIAASHNPFSCEPAYWLASVGGGHLPGLGTFDTNCDNVSGRMVWRELAGIADSRAKPEIRASAIYALGRTHVAGVTPYLECWEKDPEPAVRTAAINLLGDVPGDEPRRPIREAAADSSPEVRQAAAQAIGFSQNVALLPGLGTLLKDGEPKVRKAAAMSLLSFPIAESGSVLREHRGDPDYGALYGNALAATDPAPYVSDLGKIIVKPPANPDWWGGMVIDGDAWEILSRYVMSRPVSEIQAGRWDASLDALEKLQWFSSSEPRELYAFYLRSGLTARAKAFREHCEKTFAYDIDYYFKMADQSPGSY